LPSALCSPYRSGCGDPQKIRRRDARAADLDQVRDLDLLALEFALAADLVRTAVAPTWDDIAKLAVIATIRTMLNYFLAKDIAEFEPVERSGGSPPLA
jgi:uncharacterized membrane protein